MQERLQKIISASGLMSRRAAEECIKAGRVSVNGAAAILGMSADAETDNILVDGRPLPTAGEKLYIMLNKPKGDVTTLHDEKERRCITELLSGLHTRVYPVGRLDMYSEGLLICTNDGEFANRLMHPSHEVEKCYLTWVQGEDVGEAVEYLRCPMEIDGYMTRGADVDIRSLIPGGAELAIPYREGANPQLQLEPNRQLGRKLRITGKGRCNVTNNCDIKAFMENIPGDGRFLYSALNRLSPTQTK